VIGARWYFTRICSLCSNPPHAKITRLTLIQLEELSICGCGEAKDFIADGAIERGGRRTRDRRQQRQLVSSLPPNEAAVQ
jgi:ribosome-associated protein YbcJ (S4-like RNA binding protein)